MATIPAFVHRVIRNDFRLQPPERGVTVARDGADASVSPATFERDLRRVKTMARWLDTRFSLLGYRFGFETLIGLLPVAGDTVTALLGLYPIWVANRHRLGGLLQLRMGINLLIEWLVGMVPFLGDLFDTVFKANVRNAQLLEIAGRQNGLEA